MKKKLEKDQTQPMRNIIREVSEEWKKENPQLGKEIITRVIEIISIEEMKEELQIFTEQKTQDQSTY